MQVIKKCAKYSKYMKTQGKGETLSSPTGGSTVQVYHDYQKVAFKMQREHGQTEDPCITCCTEQKFSTRDDAAHRISSWTVDSSSQAYSGPEDNSTDPQETLTETSTLTFVDGHTMEEPGENNSLHGVTKIYLRDFVLIDDDDDGDMSLREKTVNNLAVMDGKAADLVRGRLFSTSSGSLSECKDEPSAPEVSPSHGKEPCCTCAIL
ncbi:paralemmin-2 [Dunckerocampus dactyliophorus]|uniref:paralemmin-2 n=1 Tax=Dunckerocampus dactyliophorus TaxID=161453 RepID=UPI0024049381|nr:paralemmin-2 [Dunckerocampus dactyliophorus]